MLRERAKPSRGSAEHQQLKAELGGVEPGPDHPRYEDFIRLTDPKPMGRPVSDAVVRGERPKAGTPEYNEWYRKNTEPGRAMYERQKSRQVQRYHEGPRGSGARQRAEQRARQRGKEVEQLGQAPDWDYATRPRGRVQEVMDFYGLDDRDIAEQIARIHPEGNLPDRTRLAATKAKKPAKPRKPEEVWYDVHKHPEGVPGGMGRAPEHHLRNRGWSPHEINEGSGKKTIQYHNPNFPDFVVSYGGGTGSKPDHNFRVLYMGTNRNIPKVHRAYSVAEAMNKVEELHGLQHGMVVQPLTAVQASLASQPNVTQNGVFVATPQPKRRKDMNDDDGDHPIGPPKVDFPTRPDEASDWTKPRKSRVAAVMELAMRESWEEA